MVSIKNRKELFENVTLKEDKRGREITLDLIESAVTAVDPKNAIKEHVKFKDETLLVDEMKFDTKSIDRVFVVGGGKASGTMAEALEEILRDKISGGEVNILKRTRAEHKVSYINLNEADHPVPSTDGQKGVKKILDLVSQTSPNTLVICLISGGGSALMPYPAGEISLDEKQEITKELLKSGATINEINAIRKHISSFKGGQLAKHAVESGATLISLILSDVVGDPLDVIASGPTAPDSTTFRDAINVLQHYGIWERTAKSIQIQLKNGSDGKIPETPKADDPIFERVHNIIIGSNFTACKAAQKKAEEMGLNSLILTSSLEGEARHIGTISAAIAKEIHSHGYPIPKPCVVIAGGETTVTVTGKGKGGRNQEVVLGASLKIPELTGTVISSIGTDGIDGPTDAAGAIVDSTTLSRAKELGLEPLKYLDNNDSYHFFQNLGDLVITGPTGTNVMDILIITCL